MPDPGRTIWARDALTLLDDDVREGLDAVESMLRETVRSADPMIDDAATMLIEAGGKRLRPLLTLLGGRFGNGGDPRLVPCGVAIELTHLATLYHDDVIDQTTLRRGVPTVNARFGNTIAILTGDFLFARASGLAADLGPYVSRRLADTIAELCEGQIMETRRDGTSAPNVDRYFGVIRRKTASLMATACHLGAWLGGAGVDQVDALTTFGDALGMAFQLADDVLDVTGAPEESGKVPGTDLREGVLTLPALETLTGVVPGGDELRAALDAADVDAALALLRSNGSVERAREAVAGWQAHAVEALESLPGGLVRDGLERLATFVGERTV